MPLRYRRYFKHRDATAGYNVAQDRDVQFESGEEGIACRLAGCQQRANFREQIVTDSRDRAVAGLLHKGSASLRVFLGQKSIFSLCEGHQVAVDRDPMLLVREDAAL